MSGSGFDVKPFVLNETGMTLVSVAFGMDAALTGLRQTLDLCTGPDAGEPPWGTDKAGLEFGQAYTDTLATVYPSVTSYRNQIVRGGSRLVGAAGSFVAMDAGGAQSLAGLTVRLDGGSR